ncbi:DUF2332 domain-containing protein [Gandjariella thermophila]|uniref:DUF2332 domain-containing protein n=1 Tax=Gandjariella thermophila TaxID=1931992 RepID=A0A4D4J4I4_9PSEU|nr:DUF2332 domain-containing protein [Gandjariella thermophila]GDY30020.1 hypothetical protein GTS_16530 [Gandjariella thermophila]
MTRSSGEALRLAQDRLRRFAEQEAAGVSPLYAHLAARAAEDPEVAGLLTAAPPEFATPTLLLAAAHRVLHTEPWSELTNYYPSLGGTYGVDGDTWPRFREFVLRRADDVRAVVATHTTQTNEVRRAALLFPAVAAAARAAGGKIGLVEVGASAGLLLGLGRFGYRYQTEQAGQLVAGPAKPSLVLHCALELAEGADFPHLPKRLDVAARIGLDRRPVDVADPEQLAWLEACVWADQPERLRLLNMAAAAQRADPPELVTGDAVDDLPGTLDRLPGGLPAVVLTSNVLPYLADARRTAFVAALREVARHRPVWWVSHEPHRAGLDRVLPDTPALHAPDGRAVTVLGLVRFDGGTTDARALARCDPHGQRLVWLP